MADSDDKKLSPQFQETLKAMVPALLEQVEHGNMDEAVAILVKLQQARTEHFAGTAFSDLLKEKAAELHQRIEAGETDSALETLQELQDARDRGLYQEVGRLTRALHSAITNFHIDARPGEAVQELSDMSEATDRLGYVVTMTEKAANTTLDLVEESMPVAGALTEESGRLKTEWKRLVDRDMSAEEFRTLYWQLDEFFTLLNDQSQTLYNNLSSILLAQDFQDLTGQVINKVTSLVKEVEASLVDLVFMASQVDEITGIVREGPEVVAEPTEVSDKGEGPQINANAEGVVSSQDDVDDLLSSLGF
ncbi:protein phosphatase CheZ [Saccharospirillum mangrovi]|uniref:protein phosphatase CheZ n=1 Tax=Saccharospirillum mangrovi TaxID=2161747 RepID=UPI001E3A50F1|nr:protein phosphatase CheZ [Saccharospirillum mangrovi]